MSRSQGKEYLNTAMVLASLLFMRPCYVGVVDTIGKGICCMIGGLLLVAAFNLARTEILKKTLTSKISRIGYLLFSFLGLVGFLFITIIVMPIFRDEMLLSCISILCAISALGLPLVIFVNDNWLFDKTQDNKQETSTADQKGSEFVGCVKR